MGALSGQAAICPSLDLPRRANAGDIVPCAAVVHDWIDGTAWMPKAPSMAVLIEAFETGLPMREIWVIGQPVEAYLSLDPDAALIHGFYSQRRGEGLGRLLLERVKEGRTYLQLWTHEPNGPAHRFYRREGFEVVERVAGGRGDGVPELRMEWRR